MSFKRNSEILKGRLFNNIVVDKLAPVSNWSFDYFFYNAVKRSHRERFTAYLFLALISPETLTQSAFQEKSAQLSQKSSK